MNQELDSDKQKILQGDKNLYNYDDHLQNTYFRNEQTSPTHWSFGPSPKWSPRESASSGFGESLFSFQNKNSPLTHSGLSRISLQPRNICTSRRDVSRTMSNSENRHRFEQNLRQGAALCQAPLGTAPSRPDTVAQLANAMLLHQPLPRPRSIQSNIGPYSIDTGRINREAQFQVQSQQFPSTFILSKTSNYQNLNSKILGDYLNSPESQSTSITSSPPFTAPLSSPTARVALRRESIRRVAPNKCQINDSKYFTEEYSEAKITNQNSSPLSNHTSQVLSLRHAPPMVQGVKLISPHELPDRIRHVFPYDLFNAVQSKCFSTIFNTNANLVVSAPTGSGKTALLELAICKIVKDHLSEQYKIVYLAPTKALCSERLRDWQKKFCQLNLPCAELTGDTNLTEMAVVRNASIIVTTPEKWDSITRKWTDHHKLVQMVKLFLIDEVHILKDIRGATLEAVVSRMKTMGANIRFIALSATVPNSDDIAIWLGRDNSNQNFPAHRETFGEEFRPVKLQKHVHGYDVKFNDYAFDKFLDSKLTSLLQKYTHKKPTMIFCFTRKSCETTAFMLSDWWSRKGVCERAWPAQSHKIIVGNKELLDVITCGVAFHHAGLDAQDRHAIQIGFLKGDISIICCTSTLAVGVNLPCHTVILKGTVGFQDGILREYSDLEVMQMLGRAGRPQFDDNAIAIIMTRAEKANHYKQMISGQDVLESTLHLNLIEHLNSEISLGSVRDLYQARTWITKTFLSVRMRKNPKHYKIADITEDWDTDERLKRVCERDINMLQAHHIVSSGEYFSCTQYGEAMCKYMVQFATMKLLLSIPRQASIEQILSTICQAIEFKDLRMKPTERSCLRKLDKSPFIKFPIGENVSTNAHKISLIIQVQLGGVQYPDEKEFALLRRQLSTDKNIIFERIQRLVRCVVECKAFDCDAVSTRHALDLARSLLAGYWENSNLQLRQIPQIGPVSHRKLCHSEINTVEELAREDSASIERILSKNPPYGKKMKDILSCFPRLTISAKITAKTPAREAQKPQVHVNVTLGYENDQVPVWNSRKPGVVFMAETSGGELSHIWRGNIMKLSNNFNLNFVVKLSGAEEEIKCWVACEEIVGTSRFIVLRHEFLPKDFPHLISKPEGQSNKVVKTKAFDESDDFGLDELDDEEILAVTKRLEKPEIDHGLDQFSDFDLIEEDSFPNLPNLNTDSITHHVRESIDSTQMENGKWTCQHDCRAGGLKKNGQKCKHRCCQEGIDKPSKTKQRVCYKSQELCVFLAEKLNSEQKTDIDEADNPRNIRKGSRRKSETNCINGENPEKKQTSYKNVEIIDLTDDSSQLLQPDPGSRVPAQRDQEFIESFSQKQATPSPISEVGLDKTNFESSISDKNDDTHEIISKSSIPSPIMMDTSLVISPRYGFNKGFHSESQHANSPITKDFDENNTNDFYGKMEQNSSSQLSLLVKAERVKKPNDKSEVITDTSEYSDKSAKRKRSCSPDAPDIEQNNVKESVNSLKRRPYECSHSIPDWVKEFDPELIDELKDFVDFIE